MQKIGSYISSMADPSNADEQVEQFKVIAFGLTMWVTAFAVLFLIDPLLFGVLATKPKLFRIFAIMSLPMIMGTGLVGFRPKSESLKELLLRAFLTAFAGSLCFSMTLLND